MEGEVVGGNRITGVAGRGAMGVVYLAHQVALNRRVAVKVVNPALADDPQFRARFQHEARMAAALEHPHIVPVYAAGEDQGRLYLTMRYVEGADLATALRREGPMPPALAVEVVEQVGSALDAAHARGLVHRDVKPANVMLTWSEGRPHAYLTDFGISKVVGAAGPTQTGTALGTLDYMAPELLVGDPYDGRADLYALGAVLYQALTGRVPFQRDTDAARMYAHLNDPVPPDDRVPPALMSVVRRAMAKQPSQRYGSARELASAARAALDGQVDKGAPAAGSAKAYERVGGPGGAVGRGPGRRGVLVGGAAGLLAAAGVGGWMWLRERDDQPTAAGGSGSPTSEPTLPDDEPGARVDPNAKALQVGPRPTGFFPVVGTFFSLNEDTTVSRVSLANAAVTNIDVGAPPARMLPGRTTALVLNKDFGLVPIDIASGRKKPAVSFDGGDTITADASDVGDTGWLATPRSLHRIDLNSGRTTATLPLDRDITSMTVDEGTLYALDRTRKQLYRYDAATGKESAAPLSTSPSAAVVASSSFGVIVGGQYQLWRLVDGQLREVSFFSGKKQVMGFVSDDTSLWAGLTASRTLQRVRPDFSGFVGAPVPGVTFGPNFLVAVWLDKVLVVDDVTSKVTTLTSTPLR